MEKLNPDLRYRKLWLLIGYLMIALVIYLSLTSSPLQIDANLPYQDKVFHALAYFVLTFWFMQIYHIRHHVVRWLVFFLCLGLLLEYLQGFDPHRFSEMGDMVANALGVMLAAGLSMTPLRYALTRLERHLG
ncbi:MAG: VanZ family protein [Gammaproteobacteria bacterium]|jgi:VanZ family protein